MSPMHRNVLSLCAVAALSLPLNACGSSQTGAEVPQAPEGIDHSTHLRCHQHGKAAAWQAISGMSEGAETFSMLTGGLGAIIALSAAEVVREDAYNEAYDQCIGEADPRSG